VKGAAVKGAAVGLALALALAAPAAAAETRRALTTLDDARACAPLASGAFAVATGGGLAIVRPDGPVAVLTALDGLPETRVHAVVETADGLWAGTEGGAALVALDGSPRVLRTAADVSVHALLPSGRGMYLGTWGRGVLHLASAGAAPVVVPSDGPGKQVGGLAEHGGTLHAAFADGPVARLEGGRLRPLPAGTPAHGAALASTGGRLFLGGIEGLYRIDGREATSVASIDARAIAASGDALLVASYGGGVFSTASGRTALRPEPGVSRWARGVGVRGTTRCAATAEGLFVADGGAWRRVPLGGPPSNDVTALAVRPSADAVVIGTFDRGAALHQGGRSAPIAGLEPHETVNAAAWQDGNVWLGTARGLVRVDAGGRAVRRLLAADGLPSSFVRSLLVLASGRLLVGTEEGAAFVDGERVTPVVAADTSRKGPPPLASPMHATWALAEGAGGTLYLGTASGLYWGKDGRFERASLASGDLRDDWVTALVASPARGDGREEIFAGTYSGGVTRLAFDRRAPARPRAVHLDGGYVNPMGLVLDGGTLLAATMDGLLARPAADDAARWEARTGASTGRDVTAVVRVGAALWTASRRGIAITSP
jgi:ligand-binding sensor domain-containing protein